MPNIEVIINDLRTKCAVVSGSKVCRIANTPCSGDWRLLTLSLNTGYEIKLYLPRDEMVSLLESFPAPVDQESDIARIRP